MPAARTNLCRMLPILVLSLVLRMESWNDALLQKSWNLLAAARWGTTQYERAAFATIASDGKLEFVLWPRSDRELRADFAGAQPAGTIAIVHTHPNCYPLPSDHDAEVARRLGIRVYTLTRNAVTFTDGRTTHYVATGDWNPARHR